MTDAERYRLADNITKQADGWTVADLEFVLGVLQTIHDHRTTQNLYHKAQHQAVTSRLRTALDRTGA